MRTDEINNTPPADDSAMGPGVQSPAGPIPAGAAPETTAETPSANDPAGASPESGAGEGAMSKRDQMLANLKAKYADRGFTDDDEYYGAAMEDYDRQREFNKAAADDMAQLKALMDGDPDFAAMVREFASSGDGAMAMRHMPDGVSAWREGDPRYAARKEILEGEARERAEIEGGMRETEENLRNSEAAMREYIQKSGMSPEEAQETMKFFGQIVERFDKGVITPEDLELFDKGRKYDADMRAAREAGRISGRNEQILDGRRKFDHSLDGLPTGGAAGTPAGGAEKEESPDLAFFSGVSDRRRANPWAGM